mmetsp:Transcript_66788/g.132392  ORF Transcript_66788/g.132392 Transcript_66788/m.132392 type:complete len:160 (-) Transcript_66788:165-644(-)
MVVEVTAPYCPLGPVGPPERLFLRSEKDEEWRREEVRKMRIDAIRYAMRFQADNSWPLVRRRTIEGKEDIWSRQRLIRVVLLVVDFTLDQRLLEAVERRDDERGGERESAPTEAVSEGAREGMHGDVHEGGPVDGWGEGLGLRLKGLGLSVGAELGEAC